ncbi:MAG: YfiR family protein [Proteobacteria bacterium]|nr:YfiR family protein [Pseudomonadota bacterium]MBI3496998.1 YfiR family protein [Pseudomonadota bacterium]
MTALALVLLPPTSGWAQAAGVDENALKAAFLYNFITFTEWPHQKLQPNDDAPFRLCVYGQDALGAALRALEAKTVNGRSLSTARVGSTAEAHKCNLLYIENFDGRPAEAMLSELSADGVLTVGEEARFAELGGIIALVKRNNRVAFVINMDAASRAGLKFSSKLLSLATVIQR